MAACIPMNINGEEVCIPVFIAVELPKLGPDPEPDPRWDELVVLDQMFDLSERISDRGLRRSVQTTLQTSMQEVTDVVMPGAQVRVAGEQLSASGRA